MEMVVGGVRSCECDPATAAVAKWHTVGLAAHTAEDMAPAGAASHQDAERSEQWLLLQLQLSALASMVKLR